MSFLCVLVLALPLGWSLCYVSRPTYGVEGVWIGMIVGMVLLAASYTVLLIRLNWNEEKKLSAIRKIEERVQFVHYKNNMK